MLAMASLLKQCPFIDWPPTLHRCLLLVVSAAVCWLLNAYVLGASAQAIKIYQKDNDQLTRAIAVRQKIILQVQSSAQANRGKVNLVERVRALDLANFMGQLTILSHRYHVEIQAIKPLTVRTLQLQEAGFVVQPFQLKAIASYQDFLGFAANIFRLPVLATVKDFHLTRAKVANGAISALNLLLVVDLYVQAPI